MPTQGSPAAGWEGLTLWCLPAAAHTCGPRTPAGPVPFLPGETAREADKPPRAAPIFLCFILAQKHSALKRDPESSSES